MGKLITICTKVTLVYWPRCPGLLQAFPLLQSSLCQWWWHRAPLPGYPVKSARSPLQSSPGSSIGSRYHLPLKGNTLGCLQDISNFHCRTLGLDTETDHTFFTKNVSLKNTKYFDEMQWLWLSKVIVFVIMTFSAFHVWLFPVTRFMLFFVSKCLKKTLKQSKNKTRHLKVYLSQGGLVDSQSHAPAQ